MAPQGEEQRARLVQRQRELQRPGVHLLQLRRAPAPARGEGLIKRDLQVELAFPAPIGVG